MRHTRTCTGPQPEIATLVFSDGSKYTGTLKNGTPHGLGTCVWKDGNQYDGEWRNGVMHGFGTYLWTSGQRYDGEWKVRWAEARADRQTASLSCPTAWRHSCCASHTAAWGAADCDRAWRPWYARGLEVKAFFDAVSARRAHSFGWCSQPTQTRAAHRAHTPHLPHAPFPSRTAPCTAFHGTHPSLGIHRTASGTAWASRCTLTGPPSTASGAMA